MVTGTTMLNGGVERFGLKHMSATNAKPLPDKTLQVKLSLLDINGHKGMTTPHVIAVCSKILNE